MSWDHYMKLRNQIDALYDDPSFRTAVRSDVISTTSEFTPATVDQGSNQHGRSLPGLEREQYKHQILLAWWAILQEDKPADVDEADEAGLEARGKFMSRIVALNHQRGDNALAADELLAVGNGILVALQNYLVPEPVFQVLGTLQQHRDRCKGQAAENVANLMHTISFLLERRDRARHPIKWDSRGKVLDSDEST